VEFPNQSARSPTSKGIDQPRVKRNGAATNHSSPPCHAAQIVQLRGNCSGRLRRWHRSSNYRRSPCQPRMMASPRSTSPSKLRRRAGRGMDTGGSVSGPFYAHKRAGTIGSLPRRKPHGARGQSAPKKSQKSVEPRRVCRASLRTSKARLQAVGSANQERLPQTGSRRNGGIRLTEGGVSSSGA
jgi:hypothetical protein